MVTRPRCGATKQRSALPAAQGEADTAAGSPDVVAVPPAAAGKKAVINAVVASVQAQMAADRKTTALKALQVGWRSRASLSSEGSIVDVSSP